MINPEWIGCTFKACQHGCEVTCLSLTNPAGLFCWVVINSANLPRIMELLETGFTLRPIKQPKEE